MAAELEQQLEALLFVTDEPLSVGVLSGVVEREPDEVRSALQGLADRLRSGQRGLAVREAGGGWRMYTAPDTYEVVERYALRGRSGRLTKAALETLAVVAYKQPVTRQQVADIRGVDVEAVLRSLTARGYVEEVGRQEAPGRPILYGTTSAMLERLGLDSLDELPPLTEFMPDGQAPDEPRPGQEQAARERLQRGGELESGRESASMDEHPPRGPGEAGAASGASGAEPGSDGHEDIQELSRTLERVARSAIDQLREAEQATELAEDPDEEIPSTSRDQGPGPGDAEDQGGT